ncbi:MAG: MogA/MoaB family molybdenum cofactor biosynthesis protein [Candidatus Sericytochromatia bacterium]|nr:MogA/MoaB family molybdenum cofactor biosynthesis protein [Candidatus Sericytochromatia bacterium]
MRVALITLSDTRSEKTDESGRILREMVLSWGGAEVTEALLLTDDRADLERELIRLADSGRVDLVLTTGGTGLGPRDNAPEATVSVCQRLVPGLAELMRSASLAKTPMASLSRAVAGMRGPCLIVNLPGSPKGTRECLEAIQGVLPHAITIARGGRPH